MAYGLEARSPLLDQELVALGAALPARFKVRGREKKIALRASLRGVVPDEHIDRAKQGFQVPMAEWFRTDLRELARDTLLGEAARIARLPPDRRRSRVSSNAIWPTRRTTRTSSGAV